jgi:hypothetical protein
MNKVYSLYGVTNVMAALCSCKSYDDQDIDGQYDGVDINRINFEQNNYSIRHKDSLFPSVAWGYFTPSYGRD